jgi:predicted dehydrogenase
MGETPVPLNEARSMPDTRTFSEQTPTRRTFIRTAAALSAAATLPTALRAATPSTQPVGHVAGSDKIRVGLVGCGGRGSGAARDCVRSSANVQIVALGDLFKDRLDGCRNNLSKRLPPEQYDVSDERCFIGFDAYQKVIDAGVDLVILAAAPGFRPLHIEAAIKAGKHVFAEKPVAVDPAGIRKVLAATELARQKNLAFVAGTQRRHDLAYNETIKRIQDGAIGKIVAGQCYWNQGGLWMKPRKPEWSDTEWQIRNWLYFTWLSGDHICEQHIHQIDVMNWVCGGPPLKALGIGGRQVRTDPAYGNIFDHFAVEFEYPGGVRVMSMCRQIDGTASRIGESVTGTEGVSNCQTSLSGKTEWKYEYKPGSTGPRAEPGDDAAADVAAAPEVDAKTGKPKRPSAYVLEHRDLIASIRNGTPLNEGQQICDSNLAAIMGRMSAYTGKLVTWDQAMNSKLDLFPQADLALGPMPTPPVAVPGKDPLV